MRFLTPICVALGLATWGVGTPADAQSDLLSFDTERLVELQTNDGTTRITGELLEVSDGLYVVRTEIGDLRVGVDAVTCAGPGCPVVLDTAGVRIAVSEGIELDSVATWLAAFAASSNADLTPLEADANGRRTVRVTDSGSGSVIDISFGHEASGLAALSADRADISLQDVSVVSEAAVGGAGAGPDALTLLQNQRVVARDALVVAVHPLNPVQKLTRDDIQRIFSGAATNWLEFGGGNRPISVLSLPPEHPRSTLLSQYFLGGADGVSSAAEVLPEDSAVNAALAQDPGAIGFLSRSRLQDAKAITLQDSCGLLTAAHPFSIKSDTYPLAYPVQAYAFPDAVAGPVARLLDWMTSDAARLSLQDTGYVDTVLGRGNIEDLGMMLVHSVLSDVDFDLEQYRDMLDRLRDAQRLSLAFRFETGSTLLDAQSIQELEVLASRMDAGDFEGLEMLIVGFADSTGPGPTNTRIALGRAEEVRKLLADRVSPATTSRLRTRTLSYGELFPLACNDSEAGRAGNRRVEIWVRRLGVRDN